MKKNSRGMAILDAALTLPIVCWLIFFILESMFVNQIQGALEAITVECTFDFVTSKKTDNFKTIMKKHLSESQVNNVHWYFVIYNDLDTMCGSSPYGGEDIIYGNWRIQFTNSAITHSDSAALATITDKEKIEDKFGPDKDEDKKSLSGKVFMLTFIYDYKFSSAFISKFFSGGSNTVKNGDSGGGGSGGSSDNDENEPFWLWARGFGVCN